MVTLVIAQRTTQARRSNILALTTPSTQEFKFKTVPVHGQGAARQARSNSSLIVGWRPWPRMACEVPKVRITANCVQNLRRLLMTSEDELLLQRLFFRRNGWPDRRGPRLRVEISLSQSPIPCTRSPASRRFTSVLVPATVPPLEINASTHRWDRTKPKWAASCQTSVDTRPKSGQGGGQYMCCR